MITVEVALRRTEAPVRETTAFYLTGSDRRRWLEAITHWRLSESAQLGAELFALPDGLGVIVAFPEAISPFSRSEAIAFGRLESAHKRLFLPVEARLEPLMAESEIETLLVHDVVVAHPALGWFGFEAARASSLWSLLAFPRLAPRRWQRPESPAPWNRRIVSVSMPIDVSLDDFFGEAKGAIGSSAPDGLPPAPGEPSSSALSQVGRRASELAARGARAFAGRLPEGADGTGPGWVDRLDAWAGRKLDRLSTELDRLRHKELHRLVELLERDVEEGLRHALPLGEGASFRGLGTPGGRLTERKVDFQLGALGGGRAADPWEVPPDLEQKLRAKYREIANRERKLGRWRRAAYVYAELLGDLDAAASVLMEGRHFREAAEIYRRHLGRPEKAAGALEAGGFYPEAVTLYEELRSWEKVGDLYAAMGKSDESRAAYARARDHFLALSDRIGASRIVETKLDDRDEAVAIVEDGWPGTTQAEPCLKRAFQLHAKYGLHDRASDLLDRLEAESTPPHLTLGLVDCLAATAGSYPDAGLRHRASDLTLRKIASRLRKAPRPERTRLVGTLYELAPEDRLLRRDGDRFLASREIQERDRVPRESVPRRDSPRPVLVRALELPIQYRYVAGRSDANVVYALGSGARGLVLVRARVGGAFQTLTWTGSDFVRAQVESGNVTMAIDGEGHVLLHAAGCDFKGQRFPKAPEVLDRVALAGDPGWLPQGTRAIQEHLSCWLVARRSGGRLVLSTHAADGGYLADVLDRELRSPRSSVFLAAQNQFVVLGVEGTSESGELSIYSFSGEERAAAGGGLEPGPEPIRTLRTELPIVSLGAAQPFTRSRLLVSMLRGVMIHWLDVAESCLVAPELDEPRASILRNGRLVVGSGRRLRVYRADPRETSLGAEIEIDPEHGPIVSVLPDHTPNQFSVLTEDGKLLLFALPAE